MDECKNCANMDNEYCFACDNGNQFKPMTNADRVRSMTDEELAMWINDVTTNALSVLALGSNKQTKTIFYWLDWLKQEAKE